MSYHARTILPPGMSKKRKEREGLHTLKPPASFPKPASKPDDSVSSNRLLAGYLAHEFLTKGTLFGEKFDAVRAGAVALAGGSVDSKRGKAGAEPAAKKEHKSYAEVASILKTDGAHIPGIVNPTQLGKMHVE